MSSNLTTELTGAIVAAGFNELLKDITRQLLRIVFTVCQLFVILNMNCFIPYILENIFFKCPTFQSQRRPIQIVCLV